MKKTKNIPITRRSITAFSVCAAILANMVLAVSSSASVRTIPSEGRNIYRLAVAQERGEAADALIIGSTYDNRVCAFAQDGTHRWDAAVGGFIFDLATGDLDGDGTDEIAAASADGHVYVFDAEGKLLWRYGAAFQDAPVWQVSISKLDGKTPVVIAGGVSRAIVSLSAKGKLLTKAMTSGAVRIILTGDFDGDGADEVAVMPVRGQAKDMLLFEGSKLTRGKQKIATRLKPWDPNSIQAKQWGKGWRQGKKPWNGLALRSANGAVGDLDGDGADELIYNPGAFSLRDEFQQVIALPNKFEVASYDRHYNMRMLAVGDLTDAPGAEIVVLEGAEIRLIGSGGEVLGRAVAPLGFTDIVYIPGNPHGSVLLASSPNGDDTLYRLRFVPGWEKAFAELKHHGLMARIDKNLQQVADATAKWHGQPLAGQSGPCDIVITHHFLSGGNPGEIDSWIAEVQAYKEKFPYPNLRFANCFWPGEDAPLMRPDGKPWRRDNRLAHDLSRAQIVAAAKHFEDADCPFWVQVGHGCSPHLEVATIAEMLKVAPKSLIGFISAEDEQLDDVVYYFEHHIKPILELCLSHKKRFIPRNKDVWWSHWPADARMRETIFNGRYRSVLLPSVEDSNSRSPELNLAPRIGMWLDGQVDDWACRSSADWFGASRSWEWEYPLTGHPQLRYNVSQAMLGARVFMFLNGERERQTGRWTPVGIEGSGLFLHLLGKGIIAPPKREQLRAISPVVLVMQQPSERFAKHGSNGHHPEYWGTDGSDGKRWAVDRLDTYWAMAPLPPTDVSTYLWGRTRRDSSHIPVTSPHGFVCMVPGSVPRAGGPWKTVWTTDGDTLRKDGREYTLAEARSAMLADLAEGEKQLPFHIEGRVFHQMIEQSPDHFIIALVDPGWLDPADRTVKLTARLPGTWKLTDRLSGEAVGTLAGPLEARVPAGTFRLLEARRN